VYNSSPLSDLLFYIPVVILFVATVYTAYRLAIKSNTGEFISFFNWFSLLLLAQLGAIALAIVVAEKTSLQAPSIFDPLIAYAYLLSLWFMPLIIMWCIYRVIAWLIKRYQSNMQ
jgi:hypothetical protein